MTIDSVIPEEPIERAARAMGRYLNCDFDDLTTHQKAETLNFARAALEASGLFAPVERLTEERDGYKSDYLRRHKDACDRYEDIIALKSRIAELERAASGREAAGRIAGLQRMYEIFLKAKYLDSARLVLAHIAETSGVPGRV